TRPGASAATGKATPKTLSTSLRYLNPAVLSQRRRDAPAARESVVPQGVFVASDRFGKVRGFLRAPVLAAAAVDQLPGALWTEPSERAERFAVFRVVRLEEALAFFAAPRLDAGDRSEMPVVMVLGGHREKAVVALRLSVHFRLLGFH